MPRPAYLVAGVAAITAGLLVLDPNVLTALATAVLAIFAAVQIFTEQAKRRSEERTADARLSAQAFQVRQILAGLIVESQSGAKPGWSLWWVELVLAQAPQVRRRLERALAVAAHAGPAVAARLRRAYVLYERALTRLAAARAGWIGFPPEFKSFSAGEQQQLGNAREELRGCCNELEGTLDDELLSEAKRIGALTPV